VYPEKLGDSSTVALLDTGSTSAGQRLLRMSGADLDWVSGKQLWHFCRRQAVFCPFFGLHILKIWSMLSPDKILEIQNWLGS